MVQSGLLLIWDKGGPVSVSVLPKIGKIPDWSRLSSTNQEANTSATGPWTFTQLDVMIS